MKTVCWISLITFLSAKSAEEERPLVSLDDGLVRGVHRTSYDGRKYSAFEGIPYAKPPVGKLRFKEPQLPSPWTGTWEATTTHTCLQYSFINQEITGHEDCLYLNVYVPREKIDVSESLDVIVHFHGGAFMLGTPQHLAGPSKLMDRDFVYVNLNYRVGPLGFLSFGDNVIPGNYGLKDQAFALQWVKRNIGKFGGNPNSVTLNGGSAGGASVHLHYFSPLSKGLFHRGIAGSGVALVPWGIRKDPYRSSKILAEDLGCPTEDTETILQCMQERSAFLIQKTIKNQYVDFEKMLPLALFGPVIEPLSETAFLSKHPYEQYEERTVIDVPFVSVVTTAEGSLPAMFYLQQLDLLNENIRTYFPPMFEYDNYDKELQEKITDKIVQHYFNNEPITMANYDKFIKLSSDRLFHAAAANSVKLQASSLTSNAYLLLVGYTGAPFIPDMEKFGVSHAEDMTLYYDFALMPSGDGKLDEGELIMKRKFLDMFVNFAKTGKPTIEGADFEPVPKDGDLRYLFIKSPRDLEMVTDNSFGNVEFWDSLGLPNERSGNDINRKIERNEL